MVTYWGRERDYIRQGRSQDSRGGAKKFFLRFENLHVANLLGGFGGMPIEKNFKIVQFGAFMVYIWIKF